MIPHHIVFIHGIGEERVELSNVLRARILKACAQTVLRISGEDLRTGAIHCIEALWSDITQDPQDVLWNRLFSPWMKNRVMPWKALPWHPANWWYRLRYWAWLRRLVIDLQGDLIAYIEAPGANRYQRIHDRIFTAFDACAKVTVASEATFQRPGCVTVVAHSLGAVIASDLLYDVHKKRRSRWWPSQLRLANFISMGSPLALYSLRYELAEKGFQRPVRMQDEQGVWINIYDPQDVIGYPLKGLNDAYRAAVFVDKEINVGQWWNPRHLLLQHTPFNHHLYWEDRYVAEVIGRKVALDWLRINVPELERRLKDEYGRYEKWLKPH